MRKAITNCEINKAPTITIDNYGTMPQINFADKLFHNGIIDLKARNKAMRIRFSNEYATKLLNDNLHLFPCEF
jgi:hypothetical protein